VISDIGKVISAEWLKLKRRRTTIVVPLLVAALAMIMIVGLEFAARREWVGVPSGFYLSAATVSWMVNFVLLLSLVIGSFMISQEFVLGTVRSCWVRPLTRRAWFTGKAISACAIVAALFAIVVLIAVLFSLFRIGFDDLTEKSYVVHSASSLGWRFVLTALLTMWSLIAVTALVTAVAALFNHPGASIATVLALGVTMSVLTIFPVVRPFLLNTIVMSPTEQMVAMSKGLPLPHAWDTLLWRSLLGGAAWMIAAVWLGDHIVRRKEIRA
jgi:ABC-type transport system involved in multi-copper enzyme maturation permease subunit